MLLEVCVDTIESVIAATNGGAGRIELCSALSEGGLTPTVGLLKIAKKLKETIPIYVMLRPRTGNDFQYSNLEMDIILSDLNDLRNAGADGFVFGALTSTNEIHVEYCKLVIERAAPLPVTFHRAFDVTLPTNMIQNLEVIKNLGFKRILTSGFKSCANEGIEYLKEMIMYCRHDDDFSIMPGAGINISNLKFILNELLYCKELHASCRIVKPEGHPISSISMGGSNSIPLMVADEHLARQMIEIINYFVSNKQLH